MAYTPNQLCLKRDRTTDSWFSFALSGNFYKYRYLRKRLLILEVTRLEGTGELTPFLPELLWSFRSLGSESFARLDAPEEEGENGRSVRLLRARGEKLFTLNSGPKKGWIDLVTELQSVESIHDVLTEVNMGVEFLEFYFLTPGRLEEFIAMIRKGRLSHDPKTTVSVAEVVVVDESDKERNLLGIYGPERNEQVVVQLVHAAAGQFHIPIEEVVEDSPSSY